MNGGGSSVQVSPFCTERWWERLVLEEHSMGLLCAVLSMLAAERGSTTLAGRQAHSVVGIVSACAAPSSISLSSQGF